VNWPPALALRAHPRARRVTLRLAADGSLRVTTPPRFNPRDLPGILEAKRPWIEARMAELAAAGRGAGWELPEEIRLLAVGAEYAVDRVQRPGAPARLTQSGPGRLLLAGDLEDRGRVGQALGAWLKAQAAARLSPWLRDLAREFSLPYDSAAVRAQRTRWGSCTRRGLINLNCRLLLLSPELCRYVLLHELCHTRHLNHSKEYWALLERVEPDCKVLDKKLAKARDFIPAWAE
jgi:predicted metal-dependent hydrolase